MCTLPIAAMAFQTMGAMQQADAQAAAYKQQAEADRQNALAAQHQAAIAAENGAQEEEAIRNKGRAIAAAQRAGFGASGLDSGAGSPLQVLTDTNYQNTMDVLQSRRNAANKSWAYQTESNNYNNQAKGNDAAASNAHTAGMFGAVGNILTGVTNLKSQTAARKSVGLK